eukprot:403331815
MSENQSAPKSILKKQGTSPAKSQPDLQNQKFSLLQSMSTGSLLQEMKPLASQSQLAPNNRGSRISSISNIKQRIQKLVDNSKNGSSKIRNDVINDMITIEELEKKEFQQLNIQKYQVKDRDDYDAQQHMMEGMNFNMGMKSPQKTQFKDSELLKDDQSQIKVSNKLQLPKIQLKSKKDLNLSGQLPNGIPRKSSLENSDQNSPGYNQSQIQLQNYKKQVEKTQFTDAELLQTVKESVKPIIPPLPKATPQSDDRITTANSKLNQTPQAKPKKQVSVQIQEVPAQQDPNIQQQPKQKIQQQAKNTSKPLVKFLSTSQNYKPTNVQVISADQLPEYLIDRDQELENLEKEIKTQKRLAAKNEGLNKESFGLKEIASSSQRKSNIPPENTFSAASDNTKKLLKEKQKAFLQQVQQGNEILNSFVTMFTSEAQQQQQKDKYQLQKSLKEQEDVPLFENPRESIKSFTDSISVQKSTLAEVLKRRAAVQKTDKSSQSHPKLKNLAIMIQRKDYNKYDTLFNFQNRYTKNKAATETAMYGDVEELQKIKRKHQNMLKDEQSDEMRIIINEYLLIKYNFKNKWVQQMDISQYLFSKFPTICDLKNGQVCLSGGISFNEDNQYVSQALLFDTRTFKIENLEDMSIARFKHQLIECHGSIYAIGGLSNRGNAPIKIVEAYDMKLSTQWR